MMLGPLQFPSGTVWWPVPLVVIVGMLVGSVISPV